MKVSKKIFSIVLAVIMLISIVPLANVFAADVVASGDCGENLTWSLDSIGVLTISGDGEMEDYDWEDTLPWESDSIKFVVIESGVTSIGCCAFYDCNSLARVYISDSVTSIGEDAFFSCESLASIYVDEDNACYSSADGVLFNKDKTKLVQYPTGSGRTSYEIPENVTSIEYYAFAECTNLTSIIIPDGVTRIGEGAFNSCRNLTSITIPGSVTSIGEDSFCNCSGLTNVVISERVAYIGYAAFALCTRLTRITIPDSVTNIGEYAFFGCDKLTIYGNSGSYAQEYAEKNDIAFVDISSSSEAFFMYSVSNGEATITKCNTSASGEVIIPAILDGYSVTNIGEGAFAGCSNLTKIIIPNGVKSIGIFAFANCTNLTNITIPDSVTTIGAGAFSGCERLTSIAIPSGVTSINHDTFYYCIGLTNITIPNSVTSIGEFAFAHCYSLTSITIPNSVTSIGEAAFAYCINLSSITIPSSVTSIGESNYGFCDDLVIYGYSGSYAQEYAEKNDIAFVDIGNTGEISYTYEVKNGEVTITECIKSVSGDVVIPSNLDGYSVTSIGSYAFSDCSSLTSITIPDSVTSIGDAAFAYCTALTDIYYSGSEEAWEQIEIGENNEYLTNVTIHYLGEPTHTHTYTSEITTPATCTETGIMTYTCSCGESYTETIPATGHSDSNNDNVCDNCGENLGDSSDNGSGNSILDKIIKFIDIILDWVISLFIKK